MSPPLVGAMSQPGTIETLLPAGVRGSVLDDRDGVDLGQDFGPGEAIDDEPGPARVDPREVPADGVVDGLAMPAVRDVGVDLADVAERCAGLLEQYRDVPHRLVRLGGGVPWERELAVQGGAGLTAEVHEAAGPDRLAETRTELLAVPVDLVGMEAAKAPVTMSRTAWPTVRNPEVTSSRGVL